MEMPASDNDTVNKPYLITELNTQDSPSILHAFTIKMFGGGQGLPLSVKKPEKVFDLGQGGDPNTILLFRP